MHGENGFDFSVSGLGGFSKFAASGLELVIERKVSRREEWGREQPRRLAFGMGPGAPRIEPWRNPQSSPFDFAQAKLYGTARVSWPPPSMKGTGYLAAASFSPLKGTGFKPVRQ